MIGLELRSDRVKNDRVRSDRVRSDSKPGLTQVV